jgi:hypothetical protein
MDIDKMEEADQISCIVCGIQENLQQCEECQQFVCTKEQCSDPSCLSIDNWNCCLHCYQEKLMDEFENQMDDADIDQCIYCGNINYNENNCNCYSYQLEDYNENDRMNSVDTSSVNLPYCEDQLLGAFSNIHIS